ncbi:MAG: hypothetical protein V1809_14710 [Planctomycetota bacterium]
MGRLAHVMLVGMVLFGCGKANDKPAPKTAPPPQPGSVVSVKRDTNAYNKLIGVVSIKIAKDGSRQVALRVKNDTKQVLWIPFSYEEGIACEAVNITQPTGSGGTTCHMDYFNVCQFPKSFRRLRPGETKEYVCKLPDRIWGQFEVEIWSGCRNEKGERVDLETKNAALKDSEVLIEIVEGTGMAPRNILTKDDPPFHPGEVKDIMPSTTEK